MAGFVFGFVLGSLFQQLRVFNNFPASLLGSFGFAFWPKTCVFNNFSGSFFKNKIILSHTILGPKPLVHVFKDLRVIKSLDRLFISTTAALRLAIPPRPKGYHTSPLLSSTFSMCFRFARFGVGRKWGEDADCNTKSGFEKTPDPGPVFLHRSGGAQVAAAREQVQPDSRSPGKCVHLLPGNVRVVLGVEHHDL